MSVLKKEKRRKRESRKQSNPTERERKEVSLIKIIIKHIKKLSQERQKVFT